MRRSLIPTAVVISIVLLSLNGAPAYGGGRGRPGGGGRVPGGFSGGRHFASMPARGGQTFTGSGKGTWGGPRWGGRQRNGGNWEPQLGGPDVGWPQLERRQLEPQLEWPGWSQRALALDRNRSN